MTGEELLARLDGVKRKASGGWMARCPAHEDRAPSLSIDLGAAGDRLLLHCFNGCPPEAIAQALGLTMADLFLEPRSQSAPIAAIAANGAANGASNGVARVTWYDGRDLSGQVVARHRRIDKPGTKKDVKWFLPGATASGLQNRVKLEDLTLFDSTQLPDWPATAPIIVVEGEKATLALTSVGIPALGTMTGAAGCPTVAALAPLAGRTIILWPDNDLEGRKHMERLGLRLGEAGVTNLKWFIWTEAPDKGDAADYLASRSPAHLRADLASAFRWPIRVEDAPAAPAVPEADEFADIVSLADLQHMVFPPINWLIPDLMPQGACVIAAKSKIGKSWLALGIGLATAMGGRALGSIPITTAGRVLYLDLEGTQQRIQARCRLILGTNLQAWPERLDIVTSWPRGPEGLAKIRRYVERHPDTRLVIIDILYEFRGGMSMKQNMYDFDRETVGPINALADEMGITILLIHHTKKGKEDDVIDEMSGSSGLQSAVSTMWILTRESSGFIKLTPRGRDLIDTEPLALTWDAEYCLHRLQGSAAVLSMSAERQQLLELLDDDEPHALRDLAVEMGKSAPTVSNMLKKLLTDGLVDRPKVGYWARVRTSKNR